MARPSIAQGRVSKITATTSNLPKQAKSHKQRIACGLTELRAGRRQHGHLLPVKRHQLAHRHARALPCPVRVRREAVAPRVLRTVGEVAAVWPHARPLQPQAALSAD